MPCRLARRLGLGAIIGYIAAGAVIGPQGFGLVTDVDDIFHFAEFGVVLLLFVIGLELQPSRLWTMRQSVVGLGCMQLFVTGGALALVGRLLRPGPGSGGAGRHHPVAVLHRLRPADPGGAKPADHPPRPCRVPDPVVAGLWR